MEILLVRHAQAVEEAPGLGDAGRWLTEKGRKTMRRMARWLDEKNKRRPVVVWTSPLVRAVQSAEIVAAGAGYEGEVKAISELNPGRDPGDLVRLLGTYEADGPLALVGHEPSLSLIAAALLGQDLPGGIKKSGVVAIEWTGGKGTLRFVRDPAEDKARKTLELPAPEAPAPEEDKAAQKQKKRDDKAAAKEAKRAEKDLAKAEKAEAKEAAKSSKRRGKNDKADSGEPGEGNQTPGTSEAGEPKTDRADGKAGDPPAETNP